MITLNRNYHDFLSIRKSLDIYVTTIGTTNAKYIDTGVKPRLHLNDTWISYYSHKDKKIKFRNIKNDINDFEITIGGALNPYFIPEVSMLNENEVIYTDINNNGFSGIIHFNRNTKVFTSFHKSESVSSRLEFCSNEKELFISELSLSKNKQGSKIYKFVLPLKEKMLSTKNIIYKSKLNDYGKLICAGTENNLYFIKNMTTSTGKEFFEAAKLNLVDNKVEVLTDLKYVTDIIYHGGRIIVPLHGKNYVLKGQYELPDDKINFK